MDSTQLSSSYPSCSLSIDKDNDQTLKFDKTSLSESWPKCAVNSTSESKNEEITSTISSSTTTVRATSILAPGDLPSLAWLQKGCILNIAPLDTEETSLQSHEVVVSTEIEENTPLKEEDCPNGPASPSSVKSLNLPISSESLATSNVLSASAPSKQALIQQLSGKHPTFKTDSASLYSDDNHYLSASSGSTSSAGLHSFQSNLNSYSSMISQRNLLGSNSSHYTNGFGTSRSNINHITSESSVYGLTSSRRPPKPAYSYTHLIFMAIESTLHKCMTVNEIYNWCETHFPYFTSAGAGWKNSLRHNLSINKCFKRIPRDGRIDSENHSSQQNHDKHDNCSTKLYLCTQGSENENDELEGPGRGAYWTVESKERAQLLEAVKRNPWTALTVHNSQSTGLHHSVNGNLRTTPRLAAYQLDSVCYPPRLTASLVTRSNAYLSTNHTTTRSHLSGINGYSGSVMAPIANGDVRNSGEIAEDSEVDDSEDAEAAKYASLLKGLQLVGSGNSSYSHSSRSLSKSLNVDSNKIFHNSNHYSSDTEINDARLPSRKEMPLLHKTMKKMLLGLKKSMSDEESDAQMTDRDMQGVLDLMNMQQLANNGGVREKCAECKENNAQGCESCLARGKRNPCYVTPAPFIDHEYARFQSVLRPNVLDETRNELTLHQRSAQIHGMFSRSSHNAEDADASCDDNYSDTNLDPVYPPAKRLCSHRWTTRHRDQRQLVPSSPEKYRIRRRRRWWHRSVMKLEEDKERCISSEDEDDDDRTEPMSQPAGMADLSPSSSEMEDDERCQKTAAQILVEFSRLKRFQQQSGFWTSSSSLEKSLSDE